ncbi:MAG: hypothetical protein AB8I08_18350 [Sandaracinaceae bacterium]
MVIDPQAPSCPGCASEVWAVEDLDVDSDARFDFESVLVQRWVCQKEQRAFEGTYRSDDDLPECEECGAEPWPASVHGPLRARSVVFTAGCECGAIEREMRFSLHDVRDAGLEQ